MVSRGLSAVCCGSGRSLGMGGAALLRVLVMVGGVYVSGDGLYLSVA
jgi:hypothetical protein